MTLSEGTTSRDKANACKSRPLPLPWLRRELVRSRSLFFEQGAHLAEEHGSTPRKAATMSWCRAGSVIQIA